MHIPTGLLASVVACKNGVKRAHLVSAYIEGGLILELYSRDGVGCMISTDFYEVGIHHCLSCLALSCHYLSSTAADTCGKVAVYLGCGMKCMHNAGHTAGKADGSEGDRGAADAAGEGRHHQTSLQKAAHV